MTTKLCRTCGTTKSSDDFYKTDSAKCKSCCIKYQQARRAADKKKFDGHMKTDRAAARRAAVNAVERGASISSIYDLDVATPIYAKARRLSVETGIPHEVDHIKPIAAGGLHCYTNLQVLTREENLLKSDSS